MKRVDAFIGLGSNLSNPKQQIEDAFQALAELPETTLFRRSPLYQSRALATGTEMEQPDYLNAVAYLRTSLVADELLRHLQLIEQQQGRQRDGERWGPRTLDLDLLLFAQERIHTPSLIVPHPELANRDFVLYPLADVAPQLEVPGLGPVSQLLAACPDNGAHRID